MKAGVIAEDQALVFLSASAFSGIFKKKTVIKSQARPSRNRRPSGVLIFALELVQSGEKFV